jgi:hypothetical protein
VRAAERAIDWARDDAAPARRKIRSADGVPGVPASLCGAPCRLFDAHPASDATLRAAAAGAAGEVVARRGPALLVRTHDGGLWVGHVRREPASTGRPALKLAATRAFADAAAGFDAATEAAAHALAASPDLGDRIAAKAARRAADEAAKPPAAYRAEELARMQRNFYGFDPGYHVARHHFVVAREPQAWTPRHLATHRVR